MRDSERVRDRESDKMRRRKTYAKFPKREAYNLKGIISILNTLKH